MPMSVVVSLLGCSSEDPPPPPLEVYLVRHAEKDTAVKEDPPLTPAGEARAVALAERLADVELKGVYSTDTLRTRSTAAPTARAKQLPLQLYDPREPAPMLEALREAGGTWLVVGHSNTVPGLVEALGGRPGEPIHEASEYDRLYSVALVPDEKPVTVLARYGAPSITPAAAPEVPDPEPAEPEAAPTP